MAYSEVSRIELNQDGTVTFFVNIGGFRLGTPVEISGYASQTNGATATFRDVQLMPPESAPGEGAIVVVKGGPVIGLAFTAQDPIMVVVQAADVWITKLDQDTGDQVLSPAIMTAKQQSAQIKPVAAWNSDGTTYHSMFASPAASVSSPASTRQLTIAESTYLLQACERVVDLLALDEMWSVYLTAAQESRVAEVDFSGLLGLSERMLHGLGELVETGPRVVELVSSQSNEALVAGLQRLRDQCGPAELFDWLLEEVAEGTPLLQVFLSAWNWILGNVDDEREILLNKRKALSAGSLPNPDFRFRFKCFLVVAGIGAGTAIAAAGVVSTLGVGAVVGLGVVTAAGGIAAAWTDNCGGEVRPAVD
jgi:hypothetical protein